MYLPLFLIKVMENVTDCGLSKIPLMCSNSPSLVMFSVLCNHGHMVSFNKTAKKQHFMTLGKQTVYRPQTIKIR